MYSSLDTRVLPNTIMSPFKYFYRRQPDTRRYQASRLRNNAENTPEGNISFTLML